MNMTINIIVWITFVFIAVILSFWAWAFYHERKCRRINSCADRKCRYWKWCRHNFTERKKDEIKLRKRFTTQYLKTSGKK